MIFAIFIRPILIPFQFKTFYRKVNRDKVVKENELKMRFLFLNKKKIVYLFKVNKLFHYICAFRFIWNYMGVEKLPWDVFILNMLSWKRKIVNLFYLFILLTIYKLKHNSYVYIFIFLEVIKPMFFGMK